MFAHTGALRARTLEEVVDAALLFDGRSVPAGGRIAVIGNSHGPLVLAADAAAGRSMEIESLSPALQGRLARIVASASTVNPVDIGPGASADELATIVQMIADSDEVDSCVVVWVVSHPRETAHHVASALSQLRQVSVPIALCVIGGGDGETAGTMPSYPTPERAVGALALAAHRSAWLGAVDAESATNVAVLDPAVFIDARRRARAHTADSAETVWLGSAESADLLAAAGVPAGSARSDESPTPTDSPAPLKLLVGGFRDATFGPFVVVGAGGVDADVRSDRVVLVAPASRDAVRRAVDGLRLAPLLHGVPGRRTAAVDVVVTLVHRVGALIASIREVRHLEMNPVLVTADECVAAGARIGVASIAAETTPMRALRRRPV
jgi:acyl-CoA synthetase (NDP forming)